MRELVIDGTLIDDDSDCYTIAEIGHNHQGDIQLAKKMFRAAKEAGADAVKLQKRDNKTLYAESFYNKPYNSENAFGATYGAHREFLEFNRTQYIILQEYAANLGITFFATAFDIASADFIAELEMPAIKIASGDLTNYALLEHVADLDIPIILSTGGGSLDDVGAADEACQPDAILQCTSGYPAKYDEINLNVLGTFREHFDCVVGWSGHDTGIALAPVAFALGARIIEKHFTLDRSMKGTDQAMSLEPKAFAHMVENLKLARRALGDGVKRQYESEIEPLAKQWKNRQGQIDGIPRHPQ